MMFLRRMLCVTNGRIRLAVGLFLAGLLCIQCTQRTEAVRSSNVTTVINGKIVDKGPADRADKVRDLAANDHIALLEMCLENSRATYRDYTCRFMKQEEIGGKLGKEQEIDVKFMVQPFSVAMRWVRNVPAADRALFVDGQRSNKMLVRPHGIFAFVGPQLRAPNGPDVMKSTLRPINMFGFERSLESLIEVYRQAKTSGDLKQELGYVDASGKRVSFVKVAGRDTIVLARYLPQKESYPAAKTLVYIDMEYLVPLMVEGYGWENQLTSRYVFKDVKFNVGMTDSDFTSQANGMGKGK